MVLVAPFFDNLTWCNFSSNWSRVPKSSTYLLCFVGLHVCWSVLCLLRPGFCSFWYYLIFFDNLTRRLFPAFELLGDFNTNYNRCCPAKGGWGWGAHLAVGPALLEEEGHERPSPLPLVRPRGPAWDQARPRWPTTAGSIPISLPLFLCLLMPLN